MKIRFLHPFVLFIFCGSLLLSCRDFDADKSDLTIIRYGTSFGFCQGYCKNDLFIFMEEVQLVRSEIPDFGFSIFCSRSISEQEWNEMVSQIDLDKFLELDAVIGCPDCADGGAEYVLLEGANFRHKVTFEYQKEPEVLQSLVLLLRDLESELVLICDGS